MLKPRVYKQANDTDNEIICKILLIMVLIFGAISDETKEEATIEGGAIRPDPLYCNRLFGDACAETGQCEWADGQCTVPAPISSFRTPDPFRGPRRSHSAQRSTNLQDNGTTVHYLI